MITARRTGMLTLPSLFTVMTLGAAMALALFMGLATSVLPWLFTVIAVVLLTVLVASATRPQVGIVFAMMLIFEVVPALFQPKVPLLSGRLQAYDLLIAYLAVVVVIRAAIKGQRPLQAMGPIRWPLYYLFACLCSSLLYVRYFAPNLQSLAESRFVMAWLLVPLIALCIDTPLRYRWFVRSVAAIGVVIALYVTIQSSFDIRIMTGMRVEVLDHAMNRDVVRSIAGGGIYLVLFALFLVLNRSIERKLRWWASVPLLLLLVAGLAVQFGRGVWIAAFIGILVSAGMFRGLSGVLKILLMSAVSILLVWSAAAVFKPRLAEALVARATGVGAEIESGTSFNWRKQENDAALARIERSPLTGTGIGGEYKQTVSLRNSFQYETTYIHNGYLFYPLKMGLFASFIPLAFIIAFAATVRQGLAKHKSGRHDMALIAALCGAFTVPVVTSFTQPEWSDTLGTAAFATFMGLALLYRAFGSPLEPKVPAAR